MPDIAIIGGLLFNSLDNLHTISAADVIANPYGNSEQPMLWEILPGKEIVYLSRRKNNCIPPHKINYQANIWALKQLGVKTIIGISGVGGIRADMMAGCYVVPDQIIDYTYGRNHTFYDDCQHPIEQIDFTYPYTEQLRQTVINVIREMNLPVIEEAVCAVVQGPRFETLAEIKRLEHDGCDIIGMTVMPEVVLARELQMEYVTLAIVTNRAAGRRHSTTNEDDEVTQVVSQDKIQLVLRNVIAKL